jgi:hypothetical protein
VAQSQKSFQDTIRELWELLKAYARQETVGPLKHLGRRIGLGIAGSVLFSIGWLLLVLGLVRFLQTHTLPLVGDWFRLHNWAPYLIAMALLALAIAGALRKVLHPDPDLAVGGPREDGRPAGSLERIPR